MAGPADDKRQEERRVKELRDFQRSSPANRRCFDCNEMMPQYVCLDFNTFVCTSCSGIHREFAHRVKSISMSKFSETEVKNMIKFGGNDAAQKYWRAKHDPTFRPNGGTDGERTRNFIRLTYIDRKWVYESPRHSVKDHDQPQAASAKSSKSADKSKTSSGGDDFFSGGGDGFDTFGGSSSNVSSSATAGFASFGDFSAFETKSSAASSSQGFGDFAAFDSPGEAAPAPAAATSGFGDFGDFGSTPSPSAQAPAPVKQEFASFKIAPPPGAQFASSTGSTSSSVGGGSSIAPVKPANDFMAFSPEKKKSGDPFGFDDTPAPARSTNSASAASPFDAFGSASTSAPAPVSTPSFDAFGSTPTPAASPFDAFGAPSSAPNAFASSSGHLDPFSTPQATSSLGGSGLDIFGGASSSSAAPVATNTDPFGAFNPRTSSGSTGHGASQPQVAADPFDAFNPRTSSGSPSAQEPPKTSSSAGMDPFAAFDTLESTPAIPVTVHSTPTFPSSRGDSGHHQAPIGFGSQPVPPAPVTSDPFAFASGDVSSTGSKSNSFSMPGGIPPAPQSAPNAFGQGFGQMQQPQFPQSVPMNAGYNAMYMQQPQMHPSQQQQQQQQQQQWYGANPGFQGHPQQFQQMQSGGVQSTQGVPSRENSATQLKTASAGAASLNDPFASLSISSAMGSTPGSGSASNSRGNSFNQQAPAPPVATSSFGFGNPVGNGSTGSFSNAMPPAAPGSRGQSFQSAQAPMGGSMGTPSPVSSFSYPPQAPAAPTQPSQSPMGSFSFPAPPAAAQPAPSFGAFPPTTNSSRPNSFTQPATQPPATPANPFDFF